MFMVNTEKKTSFWARHKELTDDIFKVGCIFVSLKIMKAITDRVNVWMMFLSNILLNVCKSA